MSADHQKYYVPEQSVWPAVGALAVFFIAIGAAILVNGVKKNDFGISPYLLTTGFLILFYMLFRWFKDVIAESMTGLYSAQMDRTFRQGMSWFIFSEVMFFCAFFGALFYARILSVPWLAGSGAEDTTASVLWPEFEAVWPLAKTPGGAETNPMPWSGVPIINTILLLTSSVTLQFAHMAIEHGKRIQLKLWLALTVLLGFTFLGFQVYEYMHAYSDLNLRLDSGIYGNTFFMLTGFHGFHVTLGAIFLTVILLRILLKNHFTEEKHFAFQAAAWYWHFVDVVWLCLFIFVYVL
jgi:cytochrome c oxidase subunit III